MGHAVNNHNFGVHLSLDSSLSYRAQLTIYIVIFQRITNLWIPATNAAIAFISRQTARRPFTSELPTISTGRSGNHEFGNGYEFCKSYKIDRLAYYEGFDDVRNAIDRESRIKGWLRIKKIRLIVSVNPTWKRLE
jgi:predicted GIY-YIG superfamily endonuclease